MIPFNKPFLTGKETDYIQQAVATGKISGDGFYTKKCHDFFETNYGFNKALLTTSCTDALEMCAILLDIKEGDEVIIPSYTFVSTANAFALRGAKIIFADSEDSNPNIDSSKIEALITPNTKAIAVVHYAGVACDMEQILSIAQKHNLYVVEDAAQAIDSFYTFSNGEKKRLGSIGDLAAFSFHETKNIISGEGGLLVINNKRFADRAEIIREKGTNRSAFFRGEVNKYGWVDIGSSFLPSDVIAAFLFAQLEQIEIIQEKRKQLWNAYHAILKNVSQIRTPYIPDYASNNAHMYYIVCNSLEERSELISYLKKHDIHAVFHYLSLHKSEFYKDKYIGEELINSDLYTDRLLRLPMYYELSVAEVEMIAGRIVEFYESNKSTN